MAKPQSFAEAILNMERVLKFAGQQRVLVGVPAEKGSRAPQDGEKAAPSNAQVAYWAEYGAPEANIPARPFMMPAIEKSEAMIAAELQRSMEKALDLAATDGDVSGAKAAVLEGLNRVGLKTVSNVQKEITDADFAPLAQRTIKARLRRGRTGTKPLIDTGQLRRSISYVIRYR